MKAFLEELQRHRIFKLTDYYVTENILRRFVVLFFLKHINSLKVLHEVMVYPHFAEEEGH